MKCNNCNTSILYDCNFCPTCGTKIISKICKPCAPIIENSATINLLEDNYVTQLMPTLPIQTSTSNTSLYNSSKEKKKLLFWIILLILIFLMLSFLSFSFFSITSKYVSIDVSKDALENTKQLTNDIFYDTSSNYNTPISTNESDFILPISDTKAIIENDLKEFTLGELKIARNEIFARHGRKFSDPLLNKWFMSKSWYLNINIKYNPSDFDIKAPPLSTIEKNNISTISSYESSKITSGYIFPTASKTLLSEYDLVIDIPLLKTALNQIYSNAKIKYGDIDSLTEITKKNVQLINDAINRINIIY